MLTTTTISRFFFLPCTWLLLSLFFLSNTIIGQNTQIDFFPSGEYFSSINPHKIHQDKKGFLWIKGQSLDRFDGYNFVNLKDQEKQMVDYDIPYNNYFTSDDFLITRSDNHFFFRQINTGKVDSVSYQEIIADKDIVNKDFFFHETPDGKWYFFFFVPSTEMTIIFTLEDNKLKRLFEIDNGRPTFSLFTSDSNGNIYYTNTEETEFIKRDSNGNLLQKIPYPASVQGVKDFKLGNENTLYIYSHNSKKLLYLKENANAFELHPITKFLNNNYPHIFLHDFLVMPNGNLWVSGDDRKLISYNRLTGKINDYRKDLLKLIPNHVDILYFFKDKTDIIWINTLLGLIKVTPHQSLFDTYFLEPDCEGYCSFRGIVEGEHGKIYTSFYNGIAQINPTSKTTKKLFPNFNHFLPFGLGYDKGHLILNNGGLLNISTGKLDEQVKKMPGHHGDIGSMIQDSSGNWWNAQPNHLWFFDKKGKVPKWKKMVHLPKETEHYYLHFNEKNNQIWISNAHNLYYYSIENNTLTKYISLPNKEIINSIHKNKKGNIWLGTEQGLVVIEPQNKTSKTYTTKNGLPHNFISNILSEGDSCLWISTNSGLSRFHIEQETFTNFYTEHGLSHNEFNRISAYKTKDGQMFFGGMRGVNAFYPQDVMRKYRKQKNTGKVMLSTVTHTDQNLDTVLTTVLDLNNKQLEFYHWNKSITFEYCLNDFKNPTKNQFSYLLEGYEKVWSNASKKNFASYSTLPPGNYVFRVKAFDGRGNWNPNELAISVIVHPPWWQTTWAYLIYTLILCGIFYAVYRGLRYRLELQTQFQFEQKEAQRLKDLDTFKSRLFTNLTHEFRTPLTIILGMAKQVSKGTNKLEIDNNLKTTLLNQTELIEKNGQGLLHLVNQLLDLSKLENDAFQINLQNEDILPFLNYSVSSFQSYANQNNLALKFSTNLETLKMDFDVSLLQQVITNLISNAIKFTESGGNILVKVSQIQKDENVWLQIIIQDTGIGIPPKKLPNIFDRFYQIDGSTTRHGEGTGIGLAHTKELIKIMEGEIFVKSEESIGTEFIVQIPVKNDELPNKNASPLLFSELPFSNKNKTTKVGSSFIVPSSSLTSSLPSLLIIEDNPDVVTYLKTCLEESYQIDVAYNGKVGIETALQNIPDLIISDVMMPEKDGFEVCEFLKNDEKTSHIPIILLTAKADIDSKIDGLKRGADAYLPKPFDEVELKIRLHSLLERQQRLVNYFSNQNTKSQNELIKKSSNLPNETLQVEHVFIQKITTILEENYMDKEFSLPSLCQKIGMSRSQLFRKMKALTGTSPSNYIRSYRLKKAKHLLETTGLNVSEVAWKTGFSSLSHFSRVFHEEFGMTPSTTTN